MRLITAQTWERVGLFSHVEEDNIGNTSPDSNLLKQNDGS